jgi:hypothetical protein
MTKVKNVNLGKANYFSAIIDDEPKVGTIEFCPSEDDDISDVIVLTTEDEDLELDSDKKGIVNIEQFEYNSIENFQVIDKKTHDRLSSELEGFTAFGHNAVPVILQRGKTKESGFSFGCGSVQMTTKEITEFLSLIRNKDVQRFIHVLNSTDELDSFDLDLSVTSNRKALESLFKRFNIK